MPRTRDNTKYRLADMLPTKLVEADYMMDSLRRFHQKLREQFGSIAFTRDAAVSFFNTLTCRPAAAARVNSLIANKFLVKDGEANEKTLQTQG